ncbi:putative ionotropic glutamate receptor [Helianthus annuus]|nr:putative ionotropic glutamate receptor [Helianthus annuus]
MGCEIYKLVPTVRRWNQTMLTLIRPFTMRLWIAIIISCIVIGIAIEFLEYRERNPSFYHVPFSQKLFLIIWFPISEVFFQKGEIRNRCSKVVLVTWLTTIFIVMQIFTACLSSWLTVNQLQPKVSNEYKIFGYQKGSYVVDFVHDHLQSSGITARDTSIALSSLDDYKNALQNGIVDVIFDERPYIDLFLAKYGDTYMKVGPISDEPGLGFVELFQPISSLEHLGSF